VGITVLFRQERVPAKTLGERFGVNAKSRSDPNGGNNASVNISIHACSAETEEPSDFCHRERPLDPFDLFSQGHGWVRHISHPIEDDSRGDKLTNYSTVPKSDYGKQKNFHKTP
jgi:hypothetical protein